MPTSPVMEQVPPPAQPVLETPTGMHPRGGNGQFRRKLYGNPIIEEEHDKGALAARRSRRKRGFSTAVKDMDKPYSSGGCNQDVLVDVRSKETGKGYAVGTTHFMDKIRNNKPVVSYRPRRGGNMTNTITFGLSNTDRARHHPAAEGVVPIHVALPQAPTPAQQLSHLRVQQLDELNNVFISARFIC